jgi:hypothetical protein
LSQTAGVGARLDFAFAKVLREIELSKPAEVQQALAELEAVSREVAELETKRANPDPSYRLRPAIFLLEARSLFAEHEGDLVSAEKFAREAVAIEETLPIAFGPPTVDKPTHEFLGEFLFRRGRKDEARAEFANALARTPGRRRSQQGLAAAAGQ